MKKEIDYNKEANKLLSKLNKIMDKEYPLLVKGMSGFLKKTKDSDINDTLFIHREIMRKLLLYPLKSIRISTGDEKQSEESAYMYNVTIAKDIMDYEFENCGASNKLTEIVGGEKPNKDNMSYIG